MEFYRKDPLHFYYASGAIAISVAVAVWLTTVYMLVKRRAVYLVDFAVASSPDDCKVHLIHRPRLNPPHKHLSVFYFRWIMTPSARRVALPVSLMRTR